MEGGRQVYKTGLTRGKGSALYTTGIIIYSDEVRGHHAGPCQGVPTEELGTTDLV